MEFPSTKALDGLDLSVSPGVTGLVGANGAGKTTLISLTLGLLKPTAGSISVLGLDPGSDGPTLRAMIGYGPERNVLPDDLRAYDFVRHLAEVKGLPRDEARSRASDSLYLVGLGEERFRALGTMSTGQRQRVKLAQAIAADPKFIVLDEPTDGLDPVQRDEMLNIIRQVNREFGIDVMLSSHVLEEVERVCDYVVALDHGVLVAQGSMDELAGVSGGIEMELVELADRPTRSTRSSGCCSPTAPRSTGPARCCRSVADPTTNCSISRHAASPPRTAGSAGWRNGAARSTTSSRSTSPGSRWADEAERVGRP